MILRPTYGFVRGFAATLLLFGYFLNVVSFESFHQAVHHHDHSELHTAAAEADACHRAIYHGEVAADCHHKSHITQDETECDLCKVTVSRYYFASSVIQAPKSTFQYEEYKPASIKVFGYNHSLAYAPRGPPALS